MKHELREKVFETLNQAKKIVYGQDNMLEAIIADMVNFFAVLLVIMGSCVNHVPSPPAPYRI